MKLGIRSVFVLAFSLLATTSAWAGSGITIGGGVGLGSGPIEAIVRVEGPGTPSTTDTSTVPWNRTVVLRFNGAAGVSADGLDYLDIEVVPFEWQSITPDGATGGLTFLGFNVQRDLAVDQAATVRLTLLGVRGTFSGQASDQVRVFGEMALDLLGLGFTQRASDGADMWGASVGGAAKVGLQIGDRLQIALSYKGGLVLGKPVTVYEGIYDCYDLYDEYGYYLGTSCDERSHTDYRDVRGQSTASLELKAKLTRSLQAFGVASYNVYGVHDSTGETDNSYSGAYRFIFGVNGTF